ncbi:MAG: hypothetical protein PUC29_05635 [Clostridia bacterium]|nr:hypothetical protein [Clostridia bacterium]
MNSYFIYFGKKNCKNSFFIGENTCKGFVSHVGDYISEDEFSRVYILKGGPGTGKSTLMGRLARAAKNGGMSVTLLYCSSDPDSLDGVVMEKNGEKIGIMDGTAPHENDPEYPGACGEIVDLYPCFDNDALSEKKEEIRKLCRVKKEGFARAYCYLAAARELILSRQKLIEKAFLYEKADSFISRLADGITKEKGLRKGAVQWRQTFAVSCKGAVRLSGFDGAERKILLSDHACALPIFTERLAGELVRRGERVCVSHSPLYGIGEIYVPSTGVLLSPFADGECERIINLRRFTDAKVLSEYRGRLTFSGKCIDMAVKEALESLKEAGKAHGELEKIYTPCVDFSNVDSITEKLIASIVCCKDRHTCRP